MTPFKHQLKRLQHSSVSRSSLPNHETIRESIACHNHLKLSRSFKPAPHRARRGGSNGRVQDRHWSLPKRTINYDLAESLMDHSTNPLSSDLYQIRFKHSAKQWPSGRFRYHREKLVQSDGNIIEMTCTRTYPIVPKRKKIEKQMEKKIIDPPSPITPIDPIVQEQKKKLADKQTNFYANLFGCGKIPQLSSTVQIKKAKHVNDSAKSTSSNSSRQANQKC